MVINEGMRLDSLMKPRGALGVRERAGEGFSLLPEEGRKLPREKPRSDCGPRYLRSSGFPSPSDPASLLSRSANVATFLIVLGAVSLRCR